jgi:SH3 domain protein
MTSIQIRIPLFLAAVLLSTTALAESQYITDQFEVTLRSGTSTSNSIIAMLKSGQKVELIEQDVATRYSLVQTADGKQGYVLTRYLDNQASGRERFDKLKVQTEQLKNTIQELKSQLKELRATKQSDDQNTQRLKQDLTRTQQTLQQLRADTSDTVRVLEQNENLQTRINVLESEKKELSDENAQYKDRTAMDWFIRGAGVSLAAFLIGIIVTRIRWKKRDSWGNY